MDWMYKGVSGLVDREDYMTGRRIDKTFEIIQSQENKSKGDLDGFEPSVPQSVFESTQQQTNTAMVTIDLAAKMREDPLYEIRVKQREERRRLLDNPLKMKKLKTILESTLKQDKHKRHQKKKKYRTDSESDESDHKRHHKDRDQRRSDRKSDRHSVDTNRHKTHESNRYKDKTEDKRGFDRKYDRKLNSYESRDERRRIEKRSEERNSYRHSKPTNSSKTTRLTDEEKAKRMKEMMENAVWRECQRKSNIKSYESEEREEKDGNIKPAQFIKPLLKSATESDSLEDRIRQKRFTSQRGWNSMETNFAKK